MRAMSIFRRDAGTSTLGWRADSALRMRVSMSAMGSDVVIALSLPARLHHAGNFSRKRQLPETDAAQVELAQIAARPAAPETTVAVAALELRLLLRLLGLEPEILRNLCGSCYLRFLPLLPERHAHLSQQRQTFLIGLRRGGD